MLSEQFKTITALIGAMVFWGLSFVATKVALESFPLFTLVFARFALASLLFLLVMIRRGFPVFTRRDHGMMLLTALFEPGLYFIFETLGLKYTTAPKTALIIATTPVVVLVLSSIFLGERTRLRALTGIILSLVGIAVLIGGDPNFDLFLGGPILGDVLVFGAAVSAALYIVCARSLGSRHSALSITSMQIMYGALFYLPAFLVDLPGLTLSAISGRSFIALLFLTLFATVIAFMCYNYALTRVPASRAAVFLNGIPVVTTLGAWLILGEMLTWLQGFGGMLVLFGVFLTNLPYNRRVRPVPVTGRQGGV